MIIIIITCTSSIESITTVIKSLTRSSASTGLKYTRVLCIRGLQPFQFFFFLCMCFFSVLYFMSLWVWEASASVCMWVLVYVYLNEFKHTSNNTTLQPVVFMEMYDRRYAAPPLPPVCRNRIFCSFFFLSFLTECYPSGCSLHCSFCLFVCFCFVGILFSLQLCWSQIRKSMLVKIEIDFFLDRKFVFMSK